MCEAFSALPRIMSLAERLNFIFPTIAHILYFIQHIVNFMTKSLAAFLHLKIRL